MIFHLAARADWDDAQRSGRYERSTAGRSLEDEGFIHCADEDQVAGVADAFFAGRSDLVLLVIDPAKVASPLRRERPAGSDQAFPHLYGPLNIDAVIEVRPFRA